MPPFNASLLTGASFLCGSASCLTAAGGSSSPTPPPPPTDIVTAGLVADFDPLSGITFNTTKVSAWADAIAGYTIAQATAGLQPTFIANAIGGKPGVQFNATAGATLKNTSANLIAGGARTVMAMILPGADNGNVNGVFMFRTSAEGVAGLIGFGGLHRVSLFSTNLNAPEMDATIPVCAEWLFDGALNLTCNQYGVRQPLTTPVQDPESGAAGFQVGNLETWTDTPLNATVLRLLVYNRVLSAGELAQNRAAFNTRYNPPVLERVRPVDFWDSANPYPITLGGSTTAAPNCQAVLRLSVPAGVASVPVHLSTNLIAQGIDPSVAVFVDGAFSTAWTPTGDDLNETFTLALDGLAHTVEIWGSYQTAPLTNAVPCGTYVQSIPANVAIIPPAVAPRGVLVYGDSIVAGFASGPSGGGGVIPTKSWVSLLRQDGTRGRVAVEAFGGRALGGDCNVPVASPVTFLDLPTCAARLVTILSMYTRRQLWIEMGVNDWLHGMTLADYTATLGTLLDTVNALDPTVQVILQGATLTGLEATPNSNGDLLDTWRAAMAAAAAGRGSFVQYVNFKNVIAAGDLVGNLHPNNTGHAKIKAQAVIVLGP